MRSGGGGGGETGKCPECARSSYNPVTTRSRAWKIAGVDPGGAEVRADHIMMRQAEKSAIPYQRDDAYTREFTPWRGRCVHIQLGVAVGSGKRSCKADCAQDKDGVVESVVHDEFTRLSRAGAKLDLAPWSLTGIGRETTKPRKVQVPWSGLCAQGAPRPAERNTHARMAAGETGRLRTRSLGQSKLALPGRVEKSWTNSWGRWWLRLSASQVTRW